MSLAYEREQIPKKKEKTVGELKELLTRYEKILILDIEDVPTPVIQDLREKLWDIGTFRVIKNSLTRIAIDQLERPEIEQLKKYLTGMRALFFTNNDLYKVARIISSKSKKLPPKAGKTPSRDIIIEKGGTGLKTGPEMRDLRVAGVPIRIIENEIYVKERTKLVSENEEISPSEAKAMRILDIKPIEAKVEVIAGLMGGKIVSRETLTRPIKEYKKLFRTGINKAINLSIEAAIPSKAAFDQLLRRSFHVSLIFGLKTGLTTSETTEGLILNAYRLAQTVQEEIL